MSQPLPYKGFEWVDADEFESSLDDEDFDFIYDVDLEYPEELHNIHNSYPERMVVTKNMLSPYQKCLKEELSIKTSKVEKLIPNLSDK